MGGHKALNEIESDENTYKINIQNLMLEKQHNQMESMMCQLKRFIENKNKQICQFQSQKLKVDDSLNKIIPTEICPKLHHFMCVECNGIKSMTNEITKVCCHGDEKSLTSQSSSELNDSLAQRSP